MGALEMWVALGGGLVMDTALEVCKECEHSLATCPYGMALANCPKVSEAVQKMIRGDREEENMVEE